MLLILIRILHRLRLLLILAALLATAFCVLLLLNFTAPNPTGRRYSSEMPLITGQASTALIGSSAEEILAHDLRLVNNNDAGQRHCFCSAAHTSQNAPGDCNVCTVYLPQIDTYRRPDFISDQFVADSKNVLQLTYPDLQLMAFALGAEALHRPLWIYTRVNTVVDPQLESMVSLTGGGVVYYFAVPGYVDPVDQAARQGLVVSIIVFGGCLLSFRLEVPQRRLPAPRVPHSPKSRIIIPQDEPRQPQKQSTKPSTPMDQTQRKLRDAEDFADRVRRRSEGDIDRYSN
jgi:hypothetical protein